MAKGLPHIPRVTPYRQLSHREKLKIYITHRYARMYRSVLQLDIMLCAEEDDVYSDLWLSCLLITVTFLQDNHFHLWSTQDLAINNIFRLQSVSMSRVFWITGALGVGAATNPLAPTIRTALAVRMLFIYIYIYILQPALRTVTCREYYTRCCINTIWPPDDEQRVARNI